MKFLADECFDAGLVKVLRDDGHEVLYAVETLRGAIDDDVLTRAFSEGRILLTEDKDFGELVYPEIKKPFWGTLGTYFGNISEFGPFPVI